MCTRVRISESRKCNMQFSKNGNATVGLGNWSSRPGSVTSSTLIGRPLRMAKKVDALHIDREPRTFIHVKRAKRFDPVG